MDTVRISVVVPTRDRVDRLNACLRSLAQQDFGRDRFEVVIVDDGSVDDRAIESTVAAFESAIDVRLFRQENAGPAGARNAGAARTRYPYLAFTDDDCRPARGWLSALAAAFERDPAAALGGRVVNGCRDMVCSEASQALVDHVVEHFGRAGAPFFPSNNFALSRAAFDSVGGFDTGFPLAAGEDRDLCAKCNEAGILLRSAPDAVVDHFHALDVRRFWRQHFNYGRGARVYRRVLQERGAPEVGMEPARFYLNLVTSPFRTRPAGGRRLSVCALLVLSQVANAAGYFAERRDGGDQRSGSSGVAHARNDTGTWGARRVALAASVFLLFGAFVLLAVEARQYGRNTLAENGRWDSTKVFLEMTPMGSHHYVTTRNALAGNELRLGVWHGFNEVHFARQVDPGTIDVDLSLARGASMSVLFNRTAEGFDGIRISRDEERPGIAFRADSMGRFVERVPLPVAPGRASQRLRLDLRGERAIATLDGMRLELPRSPVTRPHWFGVRGGARPASVDRVRIVDRQGRVIVDETFRNGRGALKSGAVASLIWLAVFGLWWFARRRRGGLPVADVLAALVALVVVCAALSAVDRWYWSRAYPYAEIGPGGRRGASLARWLEELRCRSLGIAPAGFVSADVLRERPIAQLVCARDWDAAVKPSFALAHVYDAGGEPVRLVPRDQLEAVDRGSSDAFRLHFIGSSQTYGEGADAIERTFVSRVREALLEQHPGTPIEVVNLAYPGATSGPLLEAYEERWVDLRPDLVVLSLAYNDLDPDAFEANLRRFTAISREREIALVLMVEPTWHKELANHRRVRAVGSDLGVLVLDAHAHLHDDAARDSGFLWWDFIHPTSLGHAEIADWLAPRLANEIEKLVRDD